MSNDPRNTLSKGPNRPLYQVWSRSIIAYKEGWQAMNLILKDADAPFERKSFTEYIVLPLGVQPHQDMA